MKKLILVLSLLGIADARAQISPDEHIECLVRLAEKKIIKCERARRDGNEESRLANNELDYPGGVLHGSVTVTNADYPKMEGRGNPTRVVLYHENGREVNLGVSRAIWMEDGSFEIKGQYTGALGGKTDSKVSLAAEGGVTLPRGPQLAPKSIVNISYDEAGNRVGIWSEGVDEIVVKGSGEQIGMIEADEVRIHVAPTPGGE